MFPSARMSHAGRLLPFMESAAATNPAVCEQGTSSNLRCVRRGLQTPVRAIARSECPKFETGQFRKLSETLVLNGGRYWDRTSGPCRVKRVYGAYGSTICERRPQLQQALGIT